jgi:hypothetical protein
VLQEGVHAPAVHAVGPFGFVHVAAHVPQFEVVFSGVSHPLESCPSQLP